MSDLTSPPLIQVSHLPSASSFYASLCQPLGLQFLVAAPKSPAVLHYGYVSAGHKTTVFTLAEFPLPRLSHMTLSAPGSKPVLDFYHKADILNKEARGMNVLEVGEGGLGKKGEDRASTRDFDGNMIEAVYDRSRGSRSGVASIETASTEKEARRVLEWQQDVARSTATVVVLPVPTPGIRRADSYPVERPRGGPDVVVGARPGVVRRETVTTEHFGPRGTGTPGFMGIQSTGDGIGGMGIGKGVLGTLIGAAAGAAFAYAVTRSVTADPEPVPPTMPRRPSHGAQSNYTTAPMPVPAAPMPPSAAGTHAPITMVDREVDQERGAWVEESRMLPSRSIVSARERDRAMSTPRYVEYTVSSPRSPPRTAISAQAERVNGLQMIEERSHVSTSSSGRRERERRERERSQSVGRESRFEKEEVRQIMPAPSPSPSRVGVARTHKSSKATREHSSSSEWEKERVDRSERKSRAGPRLDEGDERDSYASARTHRSEASTVKPHRKSSSRVSTSSRVPEKEKPEKLERVKTRSHVGEKMADFARDVLHPMRGPEWDHARARRVPLPESEVGGGASEAGTENRRRRRRRRHADTLLPDVEGSDDDAVSVAPSDSVSSVGSKRERERLSQRMGMGERIRSGGW